jgi:hypothetical protein
MLSRSPLTIVPAPAGRAARIFPAPAGFEMSDSHLSAAALRDVAHLSGAELGMAVAHEVMQWRSDHEQHPDCWVSSDGVLTGYYYGHPFSPYRDRNALAEVWKRIDALGLRARYVECLRSVLSTAPGLDAAADEWALHTCSPELACRAAVLAVRCR